MNTLKKLAAVFAVMAVAMTAFTACGGSDSSSSTVESSAPEATEAATEAQEVTEAVIEEEESVVEEDEEVSDDFTLLDVDSTMIDIGLYSADDEEGVEYVLSLFTYDDTPYCSMIVVADDGSSDVVCGEYDAVTETDEDGIDWTLLTFTDVYTDVDIEIGFAEAEGECYILDQEGNAYEAQYLDADETIDYMGAAVAVAEME